MKNNIREKLFNGMKRSNITVRQFQRIAAAGADTSISVEDRSVEIISIMVDIPKETLEQEMSPEQFNELSKKCMSYLDKTLSAKPKKGFKVNGRTYRICYNLYKLTVGQRKKLQSLGEDILNIQNAHKVMSCIVFPVDWLGRRITVEPEQIEQDVLDCSIEPVVSSCQYFNDLLIRMQTLN